MHGHVRDTHVRLLRFANVSSMKNDERLWRGFLILYKCKNSSRWNLRNFVRDFATHTKVTAVFVNITLRGKRNDGAFVKIWYFLLVSFLKFFPSPWEVQLISISLAIINTDVRGDQAKLFRRAIFNFNIPWYRTLRNFNSFPISHFLSTVLFYFIADRGEDWTQLIRKSNSEAPTSQFLFSFRKIMHNSIIMFRPSPPSHFAPTSWFACHVCHFELLLLRFIVQYATNKLPCAGSTGNPL